ncbi:Bardet-Biedl syndrome 7 protein homolog isoform X2 [Cylas formicarius]|uniref:Bardet-Biedl syndrome 7 protein homolog isoform X2 n=1 Tax=Cylas formicarius TaxID=197179 RepID=UPI00295884A7|nr:Bardet-Biedl syndrome 7 protein homolog isoform X2 [Cylas formicarius]
MEFNLRRVDYTLVGVTNKSCLRLLPSAAPREQQKVAVGDTDGTLQVFTVRKDDVQTQFKTLPGSAITSVQTAGATGTADEKIFIAMGNEIKCFTGKGKLFSVFDSGMTEQITAMFVIGNEMLMCGKHVYAHFRDHKDVGSYLCGDVIVDVVAFYAPKTRRLTSLIACEGRMIRVLEHTRVTYSMEVESSPTVLHVYDEDGVITVLFGTIDGRIGIVDVENLHGFRRWLIANDKSASPISCIDSYDLSGNGTKNVIACKQDGNIEVYRVNVHDEMDASVIVFLQNCNEMVTGVQCGVVAAAGYDEILVATYSGRIFGLTTQAAEVNVDGATGAYVCSSETVQKIDKLRGEIEELHLRVSRERDKYQKSTLTYSDEFSAIPPLSVNSSFTLNKSNATHTMSVEVPAAIENVMVHCDGGVDLLDAEKTTAIVSRAQTTDADVLLATYRCQVDTNRIELKFRTVEGRTGTLLVYITPVLQPKCSKLLRFDVKPLSLHYRIYKFDHTDRPYNQLNVKGSFSLGEMHSWIGQCLPETPEKPEITGNTVLYYKSSLTDTLLSCSYQKGEAEFESENVFTLSVVKDFLAKKATEKRTKIEFKYGINDESVNHVIKLIEPKLLGHQQTLRDFALLAALEELEITEEENLKYLTPKYRCLLDRKRDINDSFKNFPQQSDILADTIVNLYLEYNRFKGLSGKYKAKRIRECLDPYSFEKLIDVFKPNLVYV